MSASVFVFALKDEISEYPECHAEASAQPHTRARMAIEDNPLLDV